MRYAPFHDVSRLEGKAPSFRPRSLHRSPIHPVHELQRTLGNRRAGWFMHETFLQAKLTVSQPGDILEQEADRVANQVMSMPQPAQEATEKLTRQPMPEEEEELQMQPVVEEEGEEMQRQPAEEEEEEEIRAKSEGGPRQPEVAPQLQSRIHTMRGGGQPLPESVQSFFQPRFAHDFSGVRVHTSPEAADAARALSARAFTVGRDVVFGAGEYSPDTSQGRRLLAHELTHVVQQSGSAEGSPAPRQIRGRR